MSTTRPPARISTCQGQGQGESTSEHGTVNCMDAERFHDMLRKVGLGDDAAWAGVAEKDGEFDRVVDKAIREVGE